MISAFQFFQAVVAVRPASGTGPRQGRRNRSTWRAKAENQRSRICFSCTSPPVRVGVRATQRDDAAVAQPSELVTLKHAPCRFARILVEDSLKLIHRSRFYRALIESRDLVRVWAPSPPRRRADCCGTPGAGVFEISD
jgi:hypothetical protein